MAGCLTIRVTFMDDAVHEYPVHGNGDWTIRNDDVPQLVVRPYGKEGNARHHVPLGNVRTIMVVGLAERRAERDAAANTPPDPTPTDLPPIDGRPLAGFDTVWPD